ncbi:MAG: LUD domain-containing protein [Xanthobacteraceae bacterium]|nr:LUD domain-containing protein [Xanthobacteraceae bacterium]
MSARELVLGSIRQALGVSGREAPRRKVVADRLAGHPTGVVPARGQLEPKARVALLAEMIATAAGSVAQVGDPTGVPRAVAEFLRRHNLPLSVRRGHDARLAALPWHHEGALEVTVGASDGQQLASVSHAFGAVAETGTMVLTSGGDNPTTLNFLPDNHIVIVDVGDVVADFETVFAQLRQQFGDRQLPRVVNLITGPSRSADIEQTLILGAHGPRRLHVILVGEIRG